MLSFFGVGLAAHGKRVDVDFGEAAGSVWVAVATSENAAF